MLKDQSQSELDADLQREIDAALGDRSLESLIDEPGGGEAADLPPNQRMGTIAAIHRDEAIVEFSAKEQGVCSLEQFKEPPRVGERRAFILASKVPGENLYRLALPGGAAKADWDSLQEGMTIEAMVTGQNKGGLELQVAGHKAFMPVSQIDLSRVELMDPYVGTKLKAVVMECDKRKGRVVLSRREALRQEADENRARIFETLEVGQEREGTVRRIEPYGAFVELVTGVEGLLHVSDMAWARVKNPAEVVKVGQVIRVRVLKVDPEEGRISLGLKQLGGDPWQNVELKYPVGSRHTGSVTRTEQFGAFVELEPGVEGLLHISQMGGQGGARVKNVEDVAKVGAQLAVQVSEIDLERRRIALSVRVALGSKGEEAESASGDEARAYLKSKEQAHAVQSLMGKFGGGGGLKGGIG